MTKPEGNPNDEARKPKKLRGSNVEVANAPPLIRISVFGSVSDFVIRHSSFLANAPCAVSFHFHLFLAQNLATAAVLAPIDRNPALHANPHAAQRTPRLPQDREVESSDPSASHGRGDDRSARNRDRRAIDSHLNLLSHGSNPHWEIAPASTARPEFSWADPAAGPPAT